MERIIRCVCSSFLPGIALPQSGQLFHSRWKCGREEIGGKPLPNSIGSALVHLQNFTDEPASLSLRADGGKRASQVITKRIISVGKALPGSVSGLMNKKPLA